MCQGFQVHSPALQTAKTALLWSEDAALSSAERQQAEYRLVKLEENTTQFRDKRDVPGLCSPSSHTSISLQG